ncbi:MAG: putative toxin-antitoxin system toxin component, PIN family [candidate division NC10 bacterium]|nr:putative toxin-antitoxin system toxin component, PIN family [candidate division NC10 bacterium]
MRAVFDTNILISAFLAPGGEAQRALTLAQHKRVTLYTSIPILTEFAHTLREKFSIEQGEITAALRLISRAATVVKPHRSLKVLADEPDNRILECSLEAKADVIVTGDTHLLKLREYQGVAILRLKDFLRLFPAESTEL